MIASASLSHFNYNARQEGSAGQPCYGTIPEPSAILPICQLAPHTFITIEMSSWSPVARE